MPRHVAKSKNPGGEGSNAARSRCLAAPSILLKYGGAIAPPCPPPFIDAPVNDNKYVITSDHLQPESCINEFCSIEDLSGLCRYVLTLYLGTKVYDVQFWRHFHGLAHQTSEAN